LSINPETERQQKEKKIYIMLRSATN